MGIKSDRWIRRMAVEQGMIEPFEPQQVRESAGGRGISYGTSSYGYDVRCSNEFKIFTNINSAIVDPKQFDASSFVDVKQEVCIIPPNSFALARTVEYFRIPRDVLVICLGKSTYARCFRGDTRVALVDGTAPTLEAMAVRAAAGESFWGYSLGPYGRVMVTLLEAPRYIGRDALREVELDNGPVIRCTLDHGFILRDGRLVSAADLRPGDSLMPLYRHQARGYELVYQPANGHLYPTHRLADEWNLRHELYADEPGSRRHHIDFDLRKNQPWNIARLPAGERIRRHHAESHEEAFDPDDHSATIRTAGAERMGEPDWRDRSGDPQRERALRFRRDPGRAALGARHFENWTEARRAAQSHAKRARYAQPENRHRAGERSAAAWLCDVGVRRALHAAGSNRGAARWLQCDRSVFRRFPEAVAEFRGHGRRNHRIAAIRDLPGDHDVYCLTVPEAGNFALDAGVFTSNCGIIVNVTPLEPEWEGHVTLEFSNTTPLPAKIYANEGVAQMLFIGADEVCETSYRDRGGKYQGQRGVTLPKA
jgi:dCTP deaminase